jgi:hypothetical protein
MIFWLDFSGHTGPTWGETSRVVTTPPAGFSAEAQAEIVARVAKHFSRWPVTVTDQRPASLEAGKTLHVIIGGDISWGGRVSQAQLGGAFLPQKNEVYVAHLPTWSTYPPGTAAIIAHECGHSFGLRHHVANGDYERVNPDGTCPIMGSPQDSENAVWCIGVNELGETQDDVALLTKALGSSGIVVTLTVPGMKPACVQLEPV